MNILQKKITLVLLTAFSSAQVVAWNRQVIPTNAVKSDNGTLRYTQHQAGGSWENPVEFQTGGIKQIGWDTGGICIDAYKIEMITGKFAGEVITVQYPGNACSNVNLYLGTPDEISKLQVGRPNSTVFNGTQGKLQIFLP